MQDALLLGNLDAKRDLSYAPGFVEGMWKMLQANDPDDYVLATNEPHAVREFLEEWFSDLAGKGIEEKGYLKRTGQLMIAIVLDKFDPLRLNF